jgi:hypothetical protein
MAADELYRAEPARPPLVMTSGVVPGFAADDARFMDAVAARVSFENVRWRIVQESPPAFPGVWRTAPILRRGLAGGPRADVDLARARGARVLLSGALGDGLWHATDVRRDMIRHGRLLPVIRDIWRSGDGGRLRRLVEAGLGVLTPELASRIDARIFRPISFPAPWMGPALLEIVGAVERRRNADVRGLRSHMLHSIWTRMIGPASATSIAGFVEYSAQEGLELRAPFADVRLAELVLRIPWWQREPQGHLRRTGREALGPLLPAEFATRLRQASWTEVWTANARRQLSGLAHFIERGPWLSTPFVDRGVARAMLRGALAGSPAQTAETYRLVLDFASLEAWLQTFFG